MADIDFKTMAYSLIPGVAGLLSGGALGGISGFSRGVGEYDDEEQKRQKYQNELFLKQKEDARQDQELAINRQQMALSEQQNTRAEGAAAREMEAHTLEMQKNKLSLDQAFSSQEATDRLISQIQDPKERDMAKMNPQKYREVVEDNVKRADLTKRWANILPSFMEIPKGMDPANVVEAFGEKIPEMIHWQQQMKQQLMMHKETLAAHQAAQMRDRSMLSANGELIITQKPDGTLKAQTVDSLLPQDSDFMSSRNYKESLDAMMKLYKERPIGAVNQSFDEFMAEPENKLFLALRSRKLTPEAYGTAMAGRIKERQQIEESAEKKLHDTWTQSRGRFQSASKENFEAYKATRPGQMALENMRNAERSRRSRYSAPDSLSGETTAPAPAAAPGGRPSLEDIFR